MGWKTGWQQGDYTMKKSGQSKMKVQLYEGLLVVVIIVVIVVLILAVRSDKKILRRPLTIH